MTESWSNLRTLLATEVPGESCVRIFVYYDTSSNWSNRSSVVVKKAVEVRPS